MIIDISSDIFSEIQNLGDVNYLLGLFTKNHRCAFFCEYSEIMDGELYNELLDSDKELIKEYFNRFVSQSKQNFDYILSMSSTNSSFDLEEAKMFFGQPLRIVLENSLNDGYFVDRLIELFGKKRVQELKQNNQLVYGNAGGCSNIPNYIEGLKKPFSHLPKDNSTYLRVFILIDSDKKHPTEVIPERGRITSYLEENDIPYHVLNKREMENYLPDEIIQAIPDNDEYIQTYLNLSELQKDYFDIENGFPDKNLNSMSDEVRELFNGISTDNYKILRKQKLNMVNFKTEFPKLFNGASKPALRGRINHQEEDPKELENLISNITKLL